MAAPGGAEKRKRTLPNFAGPLNKGSKRKAEADAPPEGGATSIAGGTELSHASASNASAPSGSEGAAASAPPKAPRKAPIAAGSGGQGVARPPGRPPKGKGGEPKLWNPSLGKWEEAPSLMPPPRPITAADLQRIANRTLQNHGLRGFSMAEVRYRPDDAGASSATGPTVPAAAPAAPARPAAPPLPMPPVAVAPAGPLMAAMAPSMAEAASDAAASAVNPPAAPAPEVQPGPVAAPPRSLLDAMLDDVFG